MPSYTAVLFASDKWDISALGAAPLATLTSDSEEVLELLIKCKMNEIADAYHREISDDISRWILCFLCHYFKGGYYVTSEKTYSQSLDARKIS